MAYSEELLKRIREILVDRNDVVEKKMFGGVAFMVRGNMACGPHGDALIVRIGDESAVRAMKEIHVRPMNFTGKILKSFAEIEPAGIRTKAQLRRWVEMAASYAASLPVGKRTKRKSRRPAAPKARRGLQSLRR